MGRLLDNYDKLQRSPFGAWTARNSDPGLRNMRSQRSELTSALRKGIRNARKAGDPETVEKYTNMGNAYGVQATGIGSAEQRMAGNDAYESQIRYETGKNRELAMRAEGADRKAMASPRQADFDRRRKEADDLVSKFVDPDTGEVKDRSDPKILDTVRRLGGNAKSFAGAITRRADAIKAKK